MNNFKKENDSLNRIIYFGFLINEIDQENKKKLELEKVDKIETQRNMFKLQ